MSFLKSYLPSVEWIGNYKKKYLYDDLMSGLIVAIMLIPQGMAYAMLAGLPPIIGLYSSIIPLVIYALFGTSRQLAVGPVAMVSLLTLAGIGEIATPGSNDFIMMAVLLALIVGVLQLIMGMGRLGFITNFLSHPVISGFTSAAALIIGFSQFKHLLGIELPRTQQIYLIILNAFNKIGNINWYTLLISCFCIIFLLFLKKKVPKVPAPLFVVIFSTLIVWIFSLNRLGVDIVGNVPSGLPPFTVPSINFEGIKALLPTGLTIAFIGFMESIAIAKKFASEKGYKITPNQELSALGLANIVGSFFMIYPVTGGFSRTAVNSKAKTQLAGIITAAIITLAILFLTPLFFYLPKATLAAIIIVAVLGLVDYKEIIHLWRVKRIDLVVLVFTFIGTLIIGIKFGIILGVLLSILIFIFKTTKPHYAILGKVPGESAYRNLVHFPKASTIKNTLIIRIDSQFYYGNVTFLKDTLGKLEEGREDELKNVILDASSINALDSSADRALHEIAEDYNTRGIKFILANVKYPVWEVMKKSGFVDKVGGENFYLTVENAAKSL